MCASVRCPHWLNITFQPSSRDMLLVQFQRGIVERNALGGAVVRAQDGGVAAAGAGSQIALVQKRELRMPCSLPR